MGFEVGNGIVARQFGGKIDPDRIVILAVVGTIELVAAGYIKNICVFWRLFQNAQIISGKSVRNFCPGNSVYIRIFYVVATPNIFIANEHGF